MKVLLLLAFFAVLSIDGFTVRSSRQKTVLLRQSSSNGEYPSVQLNEFFKGPVLDYVPAVANALSLQDDSSSPQQDFDVIELLKAPPGKPGIPRPLWLVILGSVPTGLVWYGYYKFAVEEEMLALELEGGKTPRGFGGYGTLGPLRTVYSWDRLQHSYTCRVAFSGPPWASFISTTLSFYCTIASTSCIESWEKKNPWKCGGVFPFSFPLTSLSACDRYTTCRSIGISNVVSRHHHKIQWLAFSHSLRQQSLLGKNS